MSEHERNARVDSLDETNPYVVTTNLTASCLASDDADRFGIHAGNIVSGSGVTKAFDCRRDVYLATRAAYLFFWGKRAKRQIMEIEERARTSRYWAQRLRYLRTRGKA